MVNRTIKVFARLKNEMGRKTTDYTIVKDEDQLESLVFARTNVVEPRATNYNFRFQKVFDQCSHQSEIFKIVAVPVINSVLEGFNGTIFAYGQTGSGKTYTITGSPKNYNDRGVIPRALQYIFECNEKVSVKSTLHISYMEIYNEVGYDLLGNKVQTISLEELPKIITLESKNGELHVRNLSVLPVNTEPEAMRLLFLGDTNRTIAETPLNEYSSRSHCIFTIYVTLRDEITDRVRYSKLHIVDLAGSERVYKTLSTGLALVEAKYINLSLHYLQQVILALSQAKRSHVPYRNSLVTNLLKDSLGGNCLTVMMATLALTKANFWETISTCKFTQNVSLVKTAPIINEITDPKQKIAYLEERVRELEAKLAETTGFSSSAILSHSQRKQCESDMQRFLKAEGDSLEIEPDLTKIQFCFNLLKDVVKNHERRFEEQVHKTNSCSAKVAELKKECLQKDSEITKLKRNLAVTVPERPPSSSKENSSSVNLQSYNTFLSQSGISQDFNYYHSAIMNKYEKAKLLTKVIEQCQTNINYIKQQLEGGPSVENKYILLKELEQQQGIYKKSLDEIKDIRNETIHLEANLKKVELQAKKKFKLWMEGHHQQQVHNIESFGRGDYIYWNDPSGQRNQMVPDCTCEADHIEYIPTPPTYPHRNDMFLQNDDFHEETCCGCSCVQTDSRNPAPQLTEMSPQCSFDEDYSNEADLPTKDNPDFLPRVEPKKKTVRMVTFAGTVLDKVVECGQSDENSHESVLKQEAVRDNKNSVTMQEVTRKRNGLDDDNSPTSNNNPSRHDEKPVILKNRQNLPKRTFFKDTDSTEFREFMSTVTLTGEEDLDKEIFEFYRSKFSNKQ